MLVRQGQGQQLKMFYQGLSRERRVRADHPRRQVKKLVDFDVIYQEVAPCYGVNGNVSVPPPVILKLMLLLVFYNVRFERELMATLPERLDWLWCIDVDLDDDIPDHSVLSKARGRWGTAALQHFFDRIVCQCVATGLVDGARMFMDSSLIKADAANNSLLAMSSLKSQLNRHYHELEARLAELPADWKGNGKLNQTHLSTTDPDASLGWLLLNRRAKIVARPSRIRATARLACASTGWKLVPPRVLPIGKLSGDKQVYPNNSCGRAHSTRFIRPVVFASMTFHYLKGV